MTNPDRQPLIQEGSPFFPMPPCHIHCFRHIITPTAMDSRSSSSSSGSSSEPSPHLAHEFMFVDVLNDLSQTFGVGRQKKAFLSRNSHLRKKQASIDRLKISQSAPIRVSKQSQLAHRTASPPDATIWGDSLVTANNGQGDVDPFSTCSIPITARMSVYLHHYRDHVVSSSYPIEGARMRDWWWQKAISSPAILQTFVFLAAGHKAALQSRHRVDSQVVRKSTVDSLHFKGCAIQSLNVLLANHETAVAGSTVLLVSAIMTIEAQNADLQALQAHMNGLQTLISLVGGLDVLEHLTLSTVYQSVIKIAALYNAPPILPMSAEFRRQVRHESQIFHGDEIEYKDDTPALAQLGTRFNTAPWSTKIHPSMVSHIKVFRRLIRHFEIGRVNPDVIAPTDNDLFVLFQHQLHSTHYPSHPPSVNETLRLSLLVYLNIRVSNISKLPIMKFIAETLKQSLAEPVFGYFQVTAPDLLFWILFLGGMASREFNSHSWFVLRLAQLAKVLALHEWRDVRALLGQFFYTDHHGNTAGEDLWNEVLARLCRDSGRGPDLAVVPIR
ncbi:hypothetical protein BJY04DRAFT_202963 [Aspergillus karnatakaensis]|uniref:uncharacterized protein n=1 Tax=Aspergillus karnatakaensis TaxID=1810916 RepID=UPI003CCD70C0